MNVFLSHAFEDKAFASPLAAKLGESHDVWYDDYVLKVGSSIFESVSRGLQACDYGVVLLSQHFFVKKWTKAELSGLFALEGALHKLILPIWLDVSFEQVREFSSILADRKAVMAADGVAAVANALNAAIGASGEARKQETGLSPVERIAALSAVTGEKSRSKALLNSEGGIMLVRSAAKATRQAAHAASEEFVVKAPALNLSWKSGPVTSNEWYLNLYGPTHPLRGCLIGRIDWREPGVDTAAADTVTLTICRYFGGDKPTSVISQRTYSPFITSDNAVLWASSSEVLNPGEMIRAVQNDFTDQIEKDLVSADR